MSGWLQDVRHTLRGWRSRPGFTLVVLATLALGIGANTAIFSVVEASLLAPLPFGEPDRLCMIYSQFPSMGFSKFWVSEPEYLEFSRWNQSFQEVGAYRITSRNVGGAQGNPERVVAAVASASLLHALQPQLVLGRAFLPEEDLPGAAPVVVIGERLWRRAFAGDPALVGKQIEVDGKSATVVGVLAASNRLEDAPIEVWAPLAIDPANLAGRGSHYLYLVGRLRDGVSLEAAQSEAKVLLARWEKEFPETHKPNSKEHPLVVTSLKQDLVGAARPALWILMAAVSLVLLIACANVANLLLARSEARQREVAVRSALGAGNRRLARQFFTESLMLAGSGAILGVGLAVVAVNAVLAAFPGSVTRVETVQVSWPVAAFALLVTLVTGVLFGLAPTFHAWTRSLATLLKEGGRTTGGRTRQRVRAGLVVAEVALATVLVVGAGLLLKSFLALQKVDTGFEARGVLSFELALPREQYAEPAVVEQFFTDLTARIGALPGVKAVGTASGLPPLREVDANDTDFEGVPPPPAGPLQNVDFYQIVSGDYLSAMQIQLLPGGRTFSPADEAPSAERVVMVNQRLAEVFWPGQNPIGRRLRPSFGPDVPWFKVVGVVANVKQAGVKAPVGTELYFPSSQGAQLGFSNRDRFFLVRAEGDLVALAQSIQAEVRRRDPALPVARLRSMEQVVRESTASSRFLTLLIGVFGLLALTLAAVGTFGVLSLLVEERRHELGIRLALGARAESVLARVLSQGLSLVGLGLGIGVALALVLSRWISSVLFEVKATDPSTFAVVAAVLFGVAVVACWAPAFRASRVDPIETLKAG